MTSNLKGFILAIEKGLKEASNAGSLIDHPVEHIRVVLIDGTTYTVESSEISFNITALYVFRLCYKKSRPMILEPIMLLEMKAVTEF